MKKLLLRLIRFYRRAISPLFPPTCRFVPTCSQYALEAIEKYGAAKGGWLAPGGRRSRGLQALALSAESSRSRAARIDRSIPAPSRPQAASCASWLSWGR